MTKYLLSFFCLFSIFAEAQIVKVETDSVIIYCKFEDLKKAIKLEFSYSILAYWVTENGKKKKVVEKTSPPYHDSIVALKKTPSDTIIISDYDWYLEMMYESEWLVKKHKASFFDKRNNKKVTRVKRIVTGKRGSILFYVYLDKETENELHRICKKTWQEF